MNPATIRAHRKKWIAALRSGEYKQGRGNLRVVSRKQTRHCCLGVACEISGVKAFSDPRRTADLNGWQSSLRYGFGNGRSERYFMYLPIETQRWLGVLSADPKVALPDGPLALTYLNDCGWSFERIADAIEQYGFAPEDDVLCRPAPSQQSMV